MNCTHTNTVLKSAHFQQFLYCKDCKQTLNTVFQGGREVRLTNAELKTAQKGTTKDFVEFIDETASVAVETCETAAQLEEYIRKSWDYDDQKRRHAVGTFEKFRSHVLNVLDVNYPTVSFQ